MTTLTGYIKRMDPVTKAEKLVMDIWIGTKIAEFGTKMTDWDELTREFEVDDHVTVEFEERPGNFKGKSIMYRNLKAIHAVEGAPKVTASEEEGSPFPPETPQEAPKQGAAPKEHTDSMPKDQVVPSPAPPRSGQDSREASIEAQVALKAAVDLLCGLVTTTGMTPEAVVVLVEKHLSKLTMIAASSIREARGG